MSSRRNGFVESSRSAEFPQNLPQTLKHAALKGSRWRENVGMFTVPRFVHPETRALSLSLSLIRAQSCHVTDTILFAIDDRAREAKGSFVRRNGRFLR